MTEKEYLIVYLVSNLFQTYLINKCFNIFNSLLKPQRHLFLYFSLSFYFFTTSILYITLNEPVLMLSANLLLMYLIASNYIRPIWHRVIHILLMYILFMIIESISVLCINTIFIAEFSTIQLLTFSLLVSKILSFTLINILETRKKTYGTIEIQPIYKFTLILFPIGTIVIFHALLAEKEKHIWLLISLFILFLFNVFITYLYDLLGIKYLKELDNQFLEQQNMYYQKQLALMNKNNKEIQMLHHDYQNHLIALNGILQKENLHLAEKYIKKLLDVSHSHSNTLLIDTGNTALDSVLNYKFFQSNELSIKICFDIKIPSLLPFSPIDLIIIMGNLIDNSIEAVSKLPSEKRTISIQIQYDRNMLFICIENPYDSVEIKNGKLLTTKSNSSNHGLGLESIKKIIEHYQGFIEQSLNNSVFKVEIILYGAKENSTF